MSRDPDFFLRRWALLLCRRRYYKYRVKRWRRTFKREYPRRQSLVRSR